VTLEIPAADGRESREAIEVRIFNMEKDPFPFADDSFDLVLCMEVLEHLGYSPSHMLAEAHRVLAPGGLFFLTVPNFINIKRTVNMLLNRTTEFPYSGYGIYGRHQREYAPGEVRRLLTDCGYAVEELATANVWPTFRDSVVKGLGNGLLNLVSRLPVPWLVAKREYILAAARPVGSPIAAYPGWLYEHRHLYPDPPHGIPKVLT
jgi:SAM-dependent methyltransferase